MEASLVATVAAGTSAEYYLSNADYYLEGSEPPGLWIASGGFGVQLDQATDSDQFTLLHSGLGADGQCLLDNDGGRVEQVGGYDIAFSAPKSMSVLWAIGDAHLRSQLEQVQADAVRAAIGMLDRNAAFCRRGKGGHQVEKVSLTAAAFQHGEARPAVHSDGDIFADCMLHTHAVVLNLATRADGSVGRLDGRPLFSWKMAAGAVYHQALASGLLQLGLDVEVTGKNGLFEVAGVDPALCRYFSARRSEITAEMSAMGLESADAPALAAAKALVTRRSKQTHSDRDRHAFWRERAAAVGYAPSQVVEQASSLGRATAADVDPASTVRLAVLAQLTDKASTFEHRQLVAALAAALVGTRDKVNIEDELARLSTGGRIVELNRDHWGHAVYSTPEVIQIEQGLHRRAARIATVSVPSPDSGLVERLVEAAQLNPEQAAAARTACSDRAMALIEGGPGVGKTTLLSPVTDAWAQSGWRVIGTSTAWKIANQLHDELQIESRAIDSWLAGAEHGREFLSDKTLLLIDEAGLLTSRQMDRLLSEIEAAQLAGHQVAIRLVGDRRQLQPIGSPGLRIVADAIGVQRVDTIVRQREQWARDSVTAFGNGDAKAALATFDERGLLHQGDNEGDTIKRLTRAWHGHCEVHGDTSALMIAKSNRQVLALNAAARTLLRSDGRIDAHHSVEVEAVTPSGQNHRLELATGDQVRFLQRNDDLGVINGSVGTIVDLRATPQGGATVVVKTNGRRVSFSTAQVSDESGRVQLSHAYATTCYSAQGLTTEQAFVLLDPSMDRHDIFVAASRARGNTELFVDRKGLDGRAKAARLLTDKEREVDPTERLEVLSAAISRPGIKASTLDYLPVPSQPEHAASRGIEVGKDRLRDGRRPTSERQRIRGELSHEL